MSPRRISLGRLLFSFYLPSLILAVCDGLLVPVLPLYARDFGVSYGLIGLVLAGTGIGTLIGDIPAGLLLRWLGQKGAMLLGIACIATSTVALFWAHSIPEALLYRVLTGFGTSLYTISRHAYIAATITVSSRGRAIALFGGMMRIGRFLGPTAGGTLAAAYGLRAPFLVFGAACLAALVVVALSVQDAARTSFGGIRVLGENLSSALRSRSRALASAGTGQLFAQMIRTGRRVIIPLYAADVIGLDVQAVGFIVSISSAVDMSLFYPAGLLMDRLGRKYAIVPSFAIQALGMALVPLTGSFVGLVLAASLIGLGNGLGSGSMMTLGADLAPVSARGEFLGVWRLIGDIGMSGGPLVVGWVADLILLSTAPWVMSGAGLIAALVFACLVPETLKRQRPVARPSEEGT
jgi:MFS family permease